MTTPTLQVLSLFSGIGGLDLGLERSGMTVIGQVEIDPYCQRVLAKHWPEVSRHDDVRTCVQWWTSEPRPRVDLVCGGFPCQPVSLAGRGDAQADARWLWPAFADVLRGLRPRYALLENVPGLLGRGAGDVLGDLAALGYDAEWDCVPASSVGAPHQRDRWFAVAYPQSNGWGSRRPGGSASDDPDRQGFSAKELAHTDGHGPQRSFSARSRPEGIRDPVGVGRRSSYARGASGTLADPNGGVRRRGTRIFRSPGWGELADSGQWAVEPNVGRSLDGFSAWLDRSGRLAESYKLVSAYADASGCSTFEVLRVLRDHHGAQGSQWSRGGGRCCFSSSEVLLAYLRELPGRCDARDADVASQKTPEECVRVMRVGEVPARTSCERRPERRTTGELPDALYSLSQLLARAAGQAWAAYRGSDASIATSWNWEDGLDRVAHGVPGRVDRIRSLGNAVVPQVAEHIGRLIVAGVS